MTRRLTTAAGPVKFRGCRGPGSPRTRGRARGLDAGRRRRSRGPHPGLDVAHAIVHELDRHLVVLLVPAADGGEAAEAQPRLRDTPDAAIEEGPVLARPVP